MSFYYTSYYSLVPQPILTQVFRDLSKNSNKFILLKIKKKERKRKFHCGRPLYTASVTRDFCILSSSLISHFIISLSHKIIIFLQPQLNVIVSNCFVRLSTWNIWIVMYASRYPQCTLLLPLASFLPLSKTGILSLRNTVNSSKSGQSCNIEAPVS